ncbi:3-[(3aS,4S,7aS)-7a-methyl-1,5-dioxo-octahydro-1H-inden-4-yl]propanoyl:CoA ligase-like [Gigantopelta aegis]|uniref:3-[(3aS,4S,7aS)-7a-methyl-1, 5-dioxo-octahydro-1H-inden-4-yl]propanoyl:CoA ligase-like n=1 Tax=Gigantopelta aegis TaxID=1735272 RepID=UPI001B88BCD9|nr:3-[(3aS,4S,7aS)-7a-methyl-1,5-dioxo-octahydro-1H-inden-4-yl]propanoyl:CoA ligase-like [Gigantopelta aegis]
MQTTIQARVKFLAETYPNKEVFVFVSTTGLRSALSCLDMYELSSKVGSLLRKAGIKPGDVVCDTLPNSPEMVVCDFGILAAGGVILNKTAYRSDGSDLCHMLNTSKCKVVIADQTQSPCIWEILKRQIDEISSDGLVKSEKLPFLERVIFAPITNGNNEFIKRIKTEDIYFYTSGSPSDTGIIWMTSGTTGLPKLIVRSHEAVLINARIFASMTNESFSTIHYNDNAMGHASSFANSFLASCAKRVFIDHRFQLPVDQEMFIWELVCSEKCTTALMPPFVFRGILRKPELLKKQNYLLDLLCTAGQPVDKDWSEVLGKITRSASFAYGLSEIGYCCSQLCVTSSDMLPYVAGYPSAEGIEVKIVDENQQETSPSTHGELLVRAPWMFDGYLGNEEKSKSKFTQDGWFKTDDLAYKDKDGCLFVMCRRSDAIAWGMCTVYPAYFETPIRSLSVIADVIIVPVPDKDSFQEICACIRLCEGIALNEKEVADMCDSLFVEDSDMPAPKYYMVMENFPYLTSAKPDKTKLISLAKEKFNLN